MLVKVIVDTFELQSLFVNRGIIIRLKIKFVCQMLRYNFLLYVL